MPDEHAPCGSEALDELLRDEWGERHHVMRHDIES